MLIDSIVAAAKVIRHLLHLINFSIGDYGATLPARNRHALFISSLLGSSCLQPMPPLRHS